MPKFNKTESELKTKFDKWLYVLKNLSTFESYPKKLQERVFKKLFKEAEIAAFKPEDLLKYEDSLKVYRDFKNVIDTARDEGKDEGLTEGLAKGLAEGEKKKERDMILRMKKKRPIGR